MWISRYIWFNQKRPPFLKNKSCILVISIIFLSLQGFAQNVIKGIITESDSVTPMPFVYVINASNGHGQMSDGNGKFSIVASDRDSIIFSFVGYIILSSSEIIFP